MPIHHLVRLLFALSLIAWACQENPDRFERITPEVSGIHFSNTILESDSVHYFNFPYIYTGAGVGVGDFDNDGLADIFFAGNMTSSKLYHNLGDFRFNDITQQARVHTKTWCTGVTIADVNQDGWLDIHVSVSGFVARELRRNLLFINNRDLTFTESAAAYGLADQGFATQAAFFDYDRDGDLDLYLMCHENEGYGAISKLHTYSDGTGPSTDKLYQNVGTDSLGHPYYKNVSKEAGILIEGYGLGLAVSDINRDGWPDVYVANDFIANDLMYINQQDGTFTNQLAENTQQSSHNGMGVDIADFNNDGLNDIIVMDMLPESNHRQKTMTANMSYDHFQRTLNSGFSPQFIRNTLQLNQGIGPSGNPSFSEVGRLAGVHQTDWSWAPLFGDFDNDGFLDLYITNGFRRDVTNHDFQEYHEQTLMIEKGTGALSIPKVLKQLFQLDSVCLPNYIFQNTGELSFEDQTQNWGLAHPSMSNGAAYADFDNNGTLDLVVNNINSPAFLYRNDSQQQTDFHFLKIQLEGPSPNQNAVGARISVLLPDGRKLFRENYAVRGYLSSVDPVIHVGLGSDTLIEMLEIIWPDGNRNLYPQVKADSTYRFVYAKSDSASVNLSDSQAISAPLFEEVSSDLHINYQHVENVHSDFKLEPLLLHLYDYNGPGIAVGDINGDAREDFYVGGARGQTGTFFLQQPGGTYKSQPLDGSAFYEDMGALLFDHDEDGDLDLYVVSGGSSVKYFQKGHYQDRLYVNDGQGNFVRDSTALPEIQSSGSCVIAADFDGDQDYDLFVGGRITPGQFPRIPTSYLLENREGRFVDVSDTKAPGLSQAGMVSAALWTDSDNDGDADLMVVGEWMPVSYFENKNGQLHQADIPAFEGSAGWWNSLAGADMDDDGDIDYVAGNLGRNTAFKTKKGEPMRVYAKDFDGNGSLDAIATRFIQGKEYPIALRGTMISQIESIKRIFPNYSRFSSADIHQVLASFDTTGMQKREAHYFPSSYIENLGGGQFAIHPLPWEAQLAPVFGIELCDADGDGYLDILGIGNYYPTEIVSGRYDAGKGFLLRGNGSGDFVLAKEELAFRLEGDARALTGITNHNGERILLTTVNNDQMRAFRINSPDSLRYFALQPGDISADILLKNGQKRRCEFHLGQGYLSQSSRTLAIDAHARSLIIYDRNGKSRSLSLE